MIPSLALGLALGCGPTQSALPPENPTPAEAKVNPAADLHRAALAEVARLRKAADQDPMLAVWSGPYGGVPPWDKAKAEHFPKAFEAGIALLLAEVDAIAKNPEPASFDNTLRALEDAGRHQSRAETLFSVLSGNLNTPEVQAVDREWSPRITEAYDKITFNEQLFARISAVHAARNAPGLTAEQRRLVERVYDNYVRAGAKLSAEQKKRMGEINQELAVLYTDFGNKVLADEDT